MIILIVSNVLTNDVSLLKCLMNVTNIEMT
jgi:hypothetical protein